MLFAQWTSRLSPQNTRSGAFLNSNRFIDLMSVLGNWENASLISIMYLKEYFSKGTKACKNRALSKFMENRRKAVRKFE